MFFLYSLLKNNRKYMLFLCDFMLWNVSFYLSFAISESSFSLVNIENSFIKYLLIVNVSFSLIFFFFKLYDKIWRYADIEDFFYVGIADFCANFIFLLSTFFLDIRLKVGMYVVFLLISTFLTFVFRLVYRLNTLVDNKSKNNFNHTRKKVLIVGAGETTAVILREISKFSLSEYLPVGVVDDDREKIGRRILGVKIEGSTYEIPEIAKKTNAEIILFSITRISATDKRRIFNICSKTDLEVKIVPNLYELLTSKTSITSAIRRVAVEDLLGRETIIFNKEQYGNYIIGKNVLITGGGGSIGAELCRQIAKLNPKLLVILDIYENNAYDIEQELKIKYKKILNLKIEIASIRDKNKINKIFFQNNIDVVFHAAAHKHVPLMENNPEEAVKNNVFGTLNVAHAANEFNVKKFVLISTDKAVNPTNIMGATKRVCEMIIQMMNKKSKTEFVAVRFGNVLGSNGSVIPLFEKQIKKNGPVTVTHPKIIRYFMTIHEAVSLVLTAGSLAEGGEIFVLDMGDPIKIKELAENLIRFSGFVPDVDIKIEYTGLRPGEKLFEELLLNEEGIQKTKNEKIYIAKPIKFDENEFEIDLNNLKIFSENNKSEKVEFMLSKIVSTFKHQKNSA